MGTKITIEGTLAAMAERLQSLENEVIQLWSKNEEKTCQIKQLQNPNPNNTSNLTTPNSFMTMLKAFFEQKENKVQVPKPHNWDSNKRALNTFIWESKTWLEDWKLTLPSNTAKAITMIAGYMKGPVAQWYTTATWIKEQEDSTWYTLELFWKGIKMRFGDADLSFMVRTKLEKLKQSGKSVHNYNTVFNEHMGLT